MNVYGPRASSGPYSGVMAKFAEALIKNAPMQIHGDGEQTRDFTYVTDVVDAIVASLSVEEAVGEIMNVGTGEPHSVNQLAEIFCGTNEHYTARKTYVETRPGEIKDSYADISRAARILGYRPKVNLKTGIKSFMNWFVAQTEQERPAET